MIIIIINLAMLVIIFFGIAIELFKMIQSIIEIDQIKNLSFENLG